MRVSYTLLGVLVGSLSACSDSASDVVDEVDAAHEPQSDAGVPAPEAGGSGGNQVDSATSGLDSAAPDSATPELDSAAPDSATPELDSAAPDSAAPKLDSATFMDAADGMTGGDSTDSPAPLVPEAGLDAQVAETGTGGDTGTPTRSVNVTVRQVDPLGALPVIPNASLCLFPAAAPCASTGADGVVQLAELPVNEPLPLALTAPGYLSALRLVQAGTEDSGLGLHLLTQRSLAGQLLLLNGRTLDATRGHLVVQAFDGQSRSMGFAGVTVTQLMTDGSGNGGALEAYAADNLLPNPMLVETGASGMFLALDMAPGNYTVTLTHPERLCDDPFPTSSLGKDAAGKISVPVVADHQTALAVHCN